MPAAEAFDLIRRTTRANIVVEPSLEGKVVTLAVTRVSFDLFLQRVLHALGWEDYAVVYEPDGGPGRLVIVDPGRGSRGPAAGPPAGDRPAPGRPCMCRHGNRRSTFRPGIRLRPTSPRLGSPSSRDRAAYPRAPSPGRPARPRPSGRCPSSPIRVPPIAPGSACFPAPPGRRLARWIAPVLLLAGCATVESGQELVRAQRLNAQAWEQFERGQYAEGLARAREALAIRERLRPAEHVDVDESLHTVAALARWQGRYGEADALYRRSLALREATGGRESAKVADTLNHSLTGESRCYGIEFTGPDRVFRNANGATPDTVNGFGGAGGGVIVAGTSVTAVLVRLTTVGYGLTKERA